MTVRFVSLTHRNGRRVCALLPVALERRSHPLGDIDFEEAALRFAIGEGLIGSRGEATAAVVARPSYF